MSLVFIGFGIGFFVFPYAQQWFADAVLLVIVDSLLLVPKWLC